MSGGGLVIPAEWLEDPCWNVGPFDRFHALVDLSRLAGDDGEVVASLDQLARRWGWGQKRVRVFLGQMLERGVLRDAGRCGRRKRYGLVLPGGAGLVAPEGQVETVAKNGVPADRGTRRARSGAGSALEVVSGVGGRARSGQGKSTGNKGVPADRGAVGARPALLSLRREGSSLTERERVVAAGSSPEDGRVLELVEVWERFLEIRRSCLEGIGQAQGSCELTPNRAVKIVGLIAQKGKAAVLRALGNLSFSHWHCGTGKFSSEGHRLVPEAVFRLNQLEILLGSGGSVPVWLQVSREGLHQMWLHASAWPAPAESIPRVESLAGEESVARSVAAVESIPRVESLAGEESSAEPIREIQQGVEKLVAPAFQAERLLTLAELRERNPGLWKGISRRPAVAGEMVRRVS